MLSSSHDLVKCTKMNGVEIQKSLVVLIYCTSYAHPEVLASILLPRGRLGTVIANNP
jgi:hypothetical protein